MASGRLDYPGMHRIAQLLRMSFQALRLPAEIERQATAQNIAWTADGRGVRLALPRWQGERDGARHHRIARHRFG